MSNILDLKEIGHTSAFGSRRWGLTKPRTKGAFMTRRLLLVLCSCVIIWALVYGEASAVPMQRTVTVVDGRDNIVFQENILYNNTYKKPETKITENTVVTTENVIQKRISTPTTSRSSTDVRLVLKTASDLLGKSYSYGASGPNSFDCSGFTMYVYQTAGVNLPHNAAAQFNVGAKVSRGDLIAGDLVFFGYYGSNSINHVGIYNGDGVFIHASTKQGVITTSLDSSYYANNYKGAVRVLR